MENGPFMGDIPIKTSIKSGIFQLAMFDYQRVQYTQYIIYFQYGPGLIKMSPLDFLTMVSLLPPTGLHTQFMGQHT